MARRLAWQSATPEPYAPQVCLPRHEKADVFWKYCVCARSKIWSLHYRNLLNIHVVLVVWLGYIPFLDNLRTLTAGRVAVPSSQLPSPSIGISACEKRRCFYQQGRMILLRSETQSPWWQSNTVSQLIVEEFLLDFVGMFTHRLWFIGARLHADPPTIQLEAREWTIRNMPNWACAGGHPKIKLGQDCVYQWKRQRLRTLPWWENIEWLNLNVANLRSTLKVLEALQIQSNTVQSFSST